MSMALDYLYADVPRDLFNKLEVYTFGSAAKHFNNPPLAAHDVQGSRSIGHIEHYANEKDLVARWGPLYNIDHEPSNRYSGRVFVRQGGSGHMFVEHYLSVMFPLPDNTSSSKGLKDQSHAFLDETVKPDSELATRRQSAALRNLDGSHNRPRKDSMFDFEEGPVVIPDASQDHDAGSIMDAEGKTVRQLSRLWKYLGGASPDD